MKKLIVSCLLFSSVVQAAPTPSVVLENRKGIDAMTKNHPAEAQQRFLQALAKNPFEARLHLNLGLTFEVLGQMDKAQASYETAARLAKDPETHFAAAYNLGELAQKAKKVDEALKNYQEALRYSPESKETKTNIELLIQDQQGQGKGKDDQDPNQDQKDQNKDGQGDQKDQKQDPKDDQQKDQPPKDGKEDKPKEYAKNKPQPRKFKSEELSQGDVNKILGEIKQQEQKIRAEFNRKEVKDQPRDKDW